MTSPTTSITEVLPQPQLGLGTFPFSGVFSPLSQEDATEIITAFLDGGGRYIETAPVYPVREVNLGEIIRGLARDAYFIATKCVTGADAEGNKVRSGKRDVILSQCDAEKARLGVGHLDLLQAHIVAEDVPIGETAEALQHLKDQGSARFIGVSNVTLNQLKEYTAHASVDLVQNRFSFIHRSENRLIEAYCRENSIFLNPYQTIERGQLTSAYASTSAPWRDGDLRRSKHEYIGEAHDVVLRWVSKELAPLADDLGTSIEALVLAWTLRQPQVLVPVVGATKESQVTQQMKAYDVCLDEEGFTRIDEAYSRLSIHVKESSGLSVDEFRGL